MKRKFNPLILLLLIGVIVTIIGVFTLKNSLEAKKWPTTKGKITSSSVSEERKYDSSSKRHKTEYRANIRYSYNVNGRSYYNDRIFFGAVNLSRSTAEKYTRKYPKGINVIVYYNPEKPEKSVLETSIGFRNLLTLIIGIAIMILGIFFLLKPSAFNPSKDST